MHNKKFNKIIANKNIYAEISFSIALGPSFKVNMESKYGEIKILYSSRFDRQAW